MTNLQLILEGYPIDDDKLSVTIETFLTIYVYRCLDVTLNELKILVTNYKRTKNPCGDNELRIEIKNDGLEFIEFDKIADRAYACHPPIIFVDDSLVIAGLCGVSRKIIKSCSAVDPTGFCTELLGFKESCLLAPTESSIWTKFCEIDVINCIKSICKNIKSRRHHEEYTIPEDILRLESHLSQPIRTHNVYKLAGELASLKTENGGQRKAKQIDRMTPVKDLSIDRKFAEDHKLRLSDIILFPCFYILFKQFYGFKSKIVTPFIRKWFDNVKQFGNNRLDKFFNDLWIMDSPIDSFITMDKLKIAELKNYSLYKSDPKRYKPKNRIFTRQEDLEKSLIKIDELRVTISSEPEKENEDNMGWKDIPNEILDGDSIPISRLQRKRDQLINLASRITSMAKTGDRIVDFCSGTGHLAILLAHLLPKCRIVLLETKEFSVNIAKARAKKLQLNNISFYQCNLDYFTQPFEIGTSLHACGVVTDIVLQLCIEKRANFVSAPCCYGKIHQMPHVTYPRSRNFREKIAFTDYVVICHCADQTHDIETGKCNVEKSAQGEKCMDIIDTDRKLMAEEMGYSVILTRMKPENCSLKNRLLIGRFCDGGTTVK